MRLPDKHTHRLIDSLTRSQLSFALYRLPWTDECYLVLQKSEDMEKLNDIAGLNGKKGFVIAPFHQTEEHPIVLIRPDITAFDWEEITEAIASLENSHTIASVLKAAGYSTALIGKWGIGGGHESGGTPSTCPAWPTKRGFDFFFGYNNQICDNVV